MVKIPRHDECCREDVITSDYEGSFVDVGNDDNVVVDEKTEDKEELVI